MNRGMGDISSFSWGYVDEIRSTKNSVFQSLYRLINESRERRKTGQFVLEGAREIERALKTGYDVLSLFIVPDYLGEESHSILNRLGSDSRLINQVRTLSKELFSKVATRDKKDGLLIVLRQKNLLTPQALIDELSPTKAKFLLALDAIEKPGNIGAIFRTADAAGIDGVLFIDERATVTDDSLNSASIDLYHPHILRNSIGARFNLRIARISSSELRSFCEKNQIKLLAASLDENSTSIYETDLLSSIMIALGSEARGLSFDIMDSAHGSVKIPMRGLGDSLNVSTACAVVLFEALRQREQK